MCVRPVIIGLLGGISAGKSTVAGMLADLGAAVIDADRIAHEVLREPALAAEIRELLGEEALDADGRPDRRRIGELVFGDPGRLCRLEALLHPRILARLREELDEVEGVPAVVLDAPLLIEAGLADLADVLVHVEAGERVREDRAVSLRGFRPGERERRERRQRPPAEKRERADHVIVNEGSVEDLRRRVREVYAAILRRESPPREGSRP